MEHLLMGNEELASRGGLDDETTRRRADWTAEKNLRYVNILYNFWKILIKNKNKY